MELNPEIKLAKLKKLLVKIRNPVFDYAKELRDLREYRKTVDINAENYIDESYAKIKRLSIKSDNLVFVQKFLSLRSRKYQSQVEKYLNYLITNQSLFPQRISTIRGMVEIEQVELNRKKRWNVSPIANK